MLRVVEGELYIRGLRMKDIQKINQACSFYSSQVLPISQDVVTLEVTLIFFLIFILLFIHFWIAKNFTLIFIF